MAKLIHWDPRPRRTNRVLFSAPIKNGARGVCPSTGEPPRELFTTALFYNNRAQLCLVGVIIVI